MELDSQSIERRDFPIARRGYEPATVDAHLRALSAEVLQLREEARQGGGESSSLALTAGSQVQGILQAAEATAAEIVRQAQESAQQTRQEAADDAEQTRADAIARAEAHVSAVSQAAMTLLSRVESLDGEVGGLVQSVRAGAGRLSGDLTALAAGMAELYDASSGQSTAGPALAGASPVSPSPAAEVHLPAAVPEPAPLVGAAAHAPPSLHAATPPLPATAPPPAPDQAQQGPGTLPPSGLAPSAPEQTQPAGDLDGARLIALNMALNGDSRETTARYLDEHFQLADRQQLVEEVYAAIEG